MVTQHSNAGAPSQIATGPLMAPGDGDVYIIAVHNPGLSSTFHSASSTLQRDFAAANPPGTRYMALPPAAEIHARLGGWPYSGGKEYRFPDFCAGEMPGAPHPRRNSPKLVVWDDAGVTRAHCYHCRDNAATYAALRRVLGMDGAGAGIAARPVARPVARPAARVSGDKRKPVTPAAAAAINAEWRRQLPPASIPLHPGTSYPRLNVPGRAGADERSYPELLAEIPGDFIGRVDYVLGDGSTDTMHRAFPGADDGPKTWWAKKPDGAPRGRHKGIAPRFWDNPAGAGDKILIVEGEKTAAAVADAAPPGWLIVSLPGADALGTMALAPLLKGDCSIVFWPDNDPPGRKSARKSARRLLDAGLPTSQIAKVPRRLAKAAARKYNPAVKIRGLDAADLPFKAIREILAGYPSVTESHCTSQDSGAWKFNLDVAPEVQWDSVTDADALAGATREIPEPPKRDYPCLNVPGVKRYANSSGGMEQDVWQCGECANCIAHKNERHALRYAAVWRPGAIATIISIPYDTPEEAGKLRHAQLRRARNGNGGEQLPTAVLPEMIDRYGAAPALAGTLRMVYPYGLHGHSRAVTDAEGAKRDWIITDRELAPDEFAAMLPDRRSLHTSLDGNEGGKAMHSVTFVAWPAKFPPKDKHKDYRRDDGVKIHADELDGPAIAIIDPETIARRRMGWRWAAFRNAGEWMATCHGRISPELWQALAQAKADGDKDAIDAVMAEIRAETGYAGPTALLVDSLAGGEECHKLVRRHVAGLPPESITPPRPEPRRGRRKDAGPEWDIELCADCGAVMQVALPGNAAAALAAGDTRHCPACLVAGPVA